jgi:hypothetical protein
VGRQSLPRATRNDGAIRNFYKGYKPSWEDILEGVPASLTSHREFLDLVEKIGGDGKFIGILGPAGSGKSTTLMSTALSLSERTSNPIYYLRDSSFDVSELLLSLEDINTSAYYIFIDRLDLVSRDILNLYEHKRIKRGTIVFSERQNIWRRRLEEISKKYISGTYYIDRISSADVDSILKKLETFGPWTRLQQMKVADRRRELLAKSSRQLLVGLLETTSGTGFVDIIRRDYSDIGSEDHRKLLITVGLGTIHRTPIAVNIVGRALQFGGVKADALQLASETEGVVGLSNGQLAARHPVYVRELFERVVDPEIVGDCLVGLLQAFSDYRAPVIKHSTKAEGFIFKSIINNRFVRRILREDENRVLSVYSKFETIFHVDGLYWLQYGLALRSFDRHEEALEMLRTARAAYTSPQIEHAYAQQLLIIAERGANWEAAEPLVQEAVQNLRAQKYETWESDSYPIVALAEGHVRVFRKFLGDSLARELAKSYGNELLRLRLKISNQRLEETTTNLMTYATTGVWTDSNRTFDTEWDT